MLAASVASFTLTSALNAPAHAQEVVQALPNPASAELSDALRRLSRSPDNVAALVDAGRASLALGDVSGALSFLSRAQARRPEDGRVLTGLALVAVRRGEGITAVQLFDNANAAGASLSDVAAERGLAYDLIGNNARAQRLYRQALSRQASDEVIRRLALSYAISGDAAASEATLLPLLQRQDRSAYRSRAFALAIMGRDTEAVTIAETMLPPRLSGRLAPYLRYMPRLTPSQQAAAANLGRFPAASRIGQDSPQIAALAGGAGQTTSAPVSGGDRLTPSGAALGPARQAAAEPVVAPPASAPEPAPVQAPVQARVQAPTPTPTPAISGELPAITTSEAVRMAEAAVQPTAQPTMQPAFERPIRPPQPAREQSPVIVATIGEDAAFPAEQESRPSFSLSEPVAQSSPIFEAESEQTAEQLGLAEAFADFTLPGQGLPVAPSAGAVDITAIQPAREVVAPAPAPAPTSPPPPANPSRHWVQVATGQDVGAFRFDWRRIVRGAGGLLDGREAYTAPWNQTNRLVTGPFESRSAAQAFIAELAEAGVDSFRFTSAAGEEVVPLR
ncbi:hypothetical protein AAV99_00625 [Aurantiacibacter marinus]|uniref:SPOR domain-containing protein n=2 Tax=Aurantiacibacter marinus TaxID=874156 RepID=A0A0H0XQI9_9SPHN|nr:hypothetical protein AAV99_00625 [Aurantiacibacter marinus]